MEKKEGDTIERLLTMLKEDFSKEVNKDLVLNIGGIKFTSDNILPNEHEQKEILRNIYFKLTEIFDYYMDDTSENIMFYAIWVIGTYFHNQFNSYPYLFLNAMRGSGKSRLLKLISFIGNGKYTSSITEPIIFRTSGLLCIDELESIGGKDKAALRELLNASYKKGMTIMRTIRKKDLTGDTQKIEEFECFRPIAMANIWGMDEVLGDRCITRILEKSDNPIKTKRNENFEFNPTLKSVTTQLLKCSLCSVVMLKTYQETWNKYIDEVIFNYTNYYNYTNYTNYTFTPEEIKFFNKINETGIFGRNLELLLPLFCIAQLIGEDILDTFLCIGKKLNEEKKDKETNESIDVMLYEFISKQDNTLEYYKIRELFNVFKNFTEIDEEWFNLKWFGKALVRLNLAINKRRRNQGVEVMLNVAKAKEKLKIFRNEKSNT